MKLIIHIFLAAGALALAGCSSTPTRVNTGPIRARTFNFLDTGAKAQASFADTRQPVHALIQEAISRNLTSRGLSKVDARGDITVGYLVIVSDGVSTTSVNDYFGYGRGASELTDKAHEAFAVKDKNQTPYAAGTLVIDILDGKTFQVLRRNYAWRPILRDLPTDARQARLQEAVDEILKGLRLAQ